MKIVVDIGGSKTRVAGTKDLQTFSDPVIIETLQDYNAGVEALSDSIKKVAGEEGVEAIAIALAGVLSHDKRMVTGARHLPFWRGHDIVGDLEKRFNTKVYLENDTAQVGLGEAVFGAGKGSPIVVYITISTGVNGVRIVDGVIESAALGFEIGGQYLAMGDTPRTFEDLVSGKAISAKYGVASPKLIDKESPIWEDLAVIAAFGVHNTILHWSPHKVVLGGSMFNEIGISVDRVQAHVKAIMKKFPEVPEIVHSDLKDFGGLWGGMAVLRSREHA